MILPFQMRPSRRGFTLVATTVMTAVSLLLAGAMLQARSQWRSYSSLMVERLVVDAAAEAEAQDFAHQVKRQLKQGLSDIAPGDIVPTGIKEGEFFGRNPFRRVEIRGGISRTHASRPPRLFEEAEKVEKLGAAVGRQPNIGNDDDSLRLPVLWSPKGQSGPGKAEPEPTVLGADDPFGDIYSRSSYAAVAAYSKPRRAFFSEGARVGFGNAVSIHARSFPVSSFTAMSFNPEIELKYPMPASGVRDGGRVYTAGKAGIGVNNLFTTITALGGLQPLGGGGAPPLATTSTSGESVSVSDDNTGGTGGGIGNPSTGRPVVRDPDTRGVVFTRTPGSGQGPGEEIPLQAEDIAETFAAESRAGLRGLLVSEDNGGIELVRNHHAETIEDLIRVMGNYVDCEVSFTVVQRDEEKGVPHQTIAIADGGLRLKVDTQKVVEPASLRVIDGGVKNSLEAATVSSGLWAPTDILGNPSSAFFAQTSETGNGGKLYFNPDRLRFLGGAGAKGKPFSVKINIPKSGPHSEWRLFVVTDQGLGEVPGIGAGDGITIVAENPDIVFLGNFFTDPNSTPSLIVAPAVSAHGWRKGVGEAAAIGVEDRPSVDIHATVVTSGISPQECFSGRTLVGQVNVFGGVCIWEYRFRTTFAPSTVQVPTDSSLKERLLAGDAVPVLCPVVSEVRVNGNAPFTRRGVLTAKASGTNEVN